MRDLVIDTVETRIVDVPLIRPHAFATYTATTQPILLVAVRLAGGVVGLGEGVVPGGPWWGGESVETMQVIVEKHLAPIMVGRLASDVVGILRDFDAAVAGMRFAKAACDVALHDAYARALGVPVSDLLGGRCRERIEVTWALGVAPVAEAVAEIEERVQRFGHRSFKLKMGAGDPRRDTGRIVELAAALADAHLSLRIDVNARWDRMTALRELPRLAEAGVDLFEQPTPPGELATLRVLTERIGVPIMADESVCSPADALAVVQAQAADVIAIKTTKLGGLRESQKVAAVAAAAGLACHGATSLEGPFGTAASLHFAAATPAINFGSELFGPLLLAESLTTEPLDYRDGEVGIPTGPGLGVEPDWDAIEFYTRKDR